MARTKKTARKSTGGRAFVRRTVPTPVEPVPAPVPAPVLAQPEEVEEVPGRDYFFAEDQDGRIREVDADGNMQTPPPSPTPAQEDQAPPPASPAPEVPAPATTGEGRDDEDEEEEDIQHDGYYRGGMWADFDAEEEPLEISDDDGDEDPAPPLVPRAPVAPAPTPAGGDLEHPGDDEEEEDN